MNQSYLSVRTLNLWQDDHYRSDEMKEPHDGSWMKESNKKVQQKQMMMRA